MNKKSLLAVLGLPLVLSGLAFNAAYETKADDTFTGTTFNFARTDVGVNEDAVGYIDGETLIKKLKGETFVNPVELEYCKKNYRLRYDKIKFENDIPYNYGSIGETHYIEGFKGDSYSPDHLELSGSNKTVAFDAITIYQQIATIEEKDYANFDIDNWNIVYNHNVVIDIETANEILNGAYYAGLKYDADKKAWEDYEAYNTYLDNLDTYNAYLKEKEAYDIKRANIAAYLDAKENYGTYLNQYNQYLVDLETYNTKVKNYLKFEDDLNAYQENVDRVQEAKNKYDVDMANVDLQLSLMDYFYDHTKFANITSDKTIYNCLHTDAVAQVMNESNEGILSVGAKVSPAIFQSARNANTKLTAVIDEYKNNYYKKDGKTDKDRYEFYIKKFTSLKANLEKLTQCLEELYRNVNIYNEMNKRGKTEKYEALLGQLIFVSNLFHYPSKPLAYMQTNSYIGLDYKIKNKAICEFLGVEAPNLENKSVQPFGAYPTNPEDVYGDPPTVYDSKYGFSQTEIIDNENVDLQEPSPVAEPIEPTLKNFNLVESDLTDPKYNEENEPTLGIESKYLNNEKLKVVEQPANMNPSEDYKTDTIAENLSQEINAYTLTKFNLFNSKTAVSHLTFECKESYAIDEKTKSHIAMMLKNDDQSKLIHEIDFYKESDGSDLTLKHEIPPESVEGSDKFNVWLFDQDAIKTTLQNPENTKVIFDAVFKEMPLLTYTIRWHDKDNLSETILTNTGYQFFKPVYYKDDDPLKKELIPEKKTTDATGGLKGKYHYKFKSFLFKDNDEFVELNQMKCEELDTDEDGVIDLYVEFSSTYYPCVEFVNYNGTTILSIKDNEPGSRVYCETPKNTATDEFVRWEVDGKEVMLPIQVDNQDITVTAIFKHTREVTFKDSDGSTLSSRTYTYQDKEESQKPDEPTVDSKLVGDNRYKEFKRWDSSVIEVSENGNHTYNAQYTEEKDIIPNATISREVDKNTAKEYLKITVNGSVKSLDLSMLNYFIGKGYKTARAEIIFDNAKVSLTDASVNMLHALDVCTLSLNVCKDDNSNRWLVTLEALNSNDDSTGIDLSATITMNSIFGVSSAHVRAFTNINGTETKIASSDNDSLTFSVNTNEEISIARFYKVNVNANARASFTINGKEFDFKNIPEIEDGKDAVIKATPSSGYSIEKIIAYEQGNVTEEVASKTMESSDDSLTLHFGQEGNASCDIILSANVKRVNLTLTYYVDGEQYGETISAPVGTVIILDTPTKESTDELNYVFVKWEELEEGTTYITLDHNTELHAHFIGYYLTDSQDLMKGSKDAQKVVLGVSLGAVGAGFIIGLILLIAKRDKRDKD